MTTVVLVVLLALLLATWLAPSPSPAPRRRRVAELRCPWPPAQQWPGESRGWLGGRL